jgi:hypothetical protein
MFVPKSIPMKNIIQNIAHEAGINEDKARIAFLVMTANIKERFPLLHSVVDLMFEMQQSSSQNERPLIDFQKTQIIYN